MVGVARLATAATVGAAGACLLLALVQVSRLPATRTEAFSGARWPHSIARHFRAREQQLWNAASNDEVSMANVGHPHAYDFVHQPFHRGKFLQQRKLEREIATGKHHIITNPRDMDNIFEPLKWMHEQGEPEAVAPRHGLLGHWGAH